MDRNFYGHPGWPANTQPRDPKMADIQKWTDRSSQQVAMYPVHHNAGNGTDGHPYVPIPTEYAKGPAKRDKRPIKTRTKKTKTQADSTTPSSSFCFTDSTVDQISPYDTAVTELYGAYSQLCASDYRGSTPGLHDAMNKVRQQVWDATQICVRGPPSVSNMTDLEKLMLGVMEGFTLGGTTGNEQYDNAITRGRDSLRTFSDRYRGECGLYN